MRRIELGTILGYEFNFEYSNYKTTKYFGLSCEVSVASNPISLHLQWWMINRLIEFSLNIWEPL